MREGREKRGGRERLYLWWKKTKWNITLKLKYKTFKIFFSYSMSRRMSSTSSCVSHDTSRICASRGLWLPMSTLPSNCSHASRRFDLYRHSACRTGCKQFMFMSARPCMAEPLMGATINFDCFSHSLSPSLSLSLVRQTTHLHTWCLYTHVCKHIHTNTYTNTHDYVLIRMRVPNIYWQGNNKTLYLSLLFILFVVVIFTWNNFRLNSNGLDTLEWIFPSTF